MPRRPRLDRPGLLHHVTNRALARRTAFEGEADVRAFLALLANAVRGGRIEVHAFCVLSTHFHLLVRSLDGCLSETLRRVQNAYVRRFNRTRRRDGPLFRGRFRSFPVESRRYAQVLVRYIDQNPVEAHLAATPADYPYGSARHHVAGAERPRWLCRALVDDCLAQLLAQGCPRADAYCRVFPLRFSQALRAFVDRRLAGLSREPDPLEDLVGAASGSVLAWMEAKARLADGTRPGLALVAAESIRGLLDLHRGRAPHAFVQVGPRARRSVWDLAAVGLAHDLAGETYAAIGRRDRWRASDVHRRYREHRAALASDVGYAKIVAELARRALDEVQPRSGTEISHPLESPSTLSSH